MFNVMNNINMKLGRLTIFTSYTPGAGKSFLMVSKAEERMQAGEKVCFGFLNGRHRDIEKLSEGNLSKKYSLKSLLLEAPQLVVMDEMGMHGLNRDEQSFVYRDIEKLLISGIDVYTTANLKRFQEANPLFKSITGIGIKKTIPNRFLEMAERIYFVDREPEQMVEDFKKGSLFNNKYSNSKIMIKNFQLDTLKHYRDISFHFLEKYGDKVKIVKRE